jgi:hypothetical protein
MTTDETIVDASADQVLRVLGQVVDLPWPDAGVDEPLEWELDGIEGYTTWLTHIVPLAMRAEAAAVAALVVPLMEGADRRWSVRRWFDATRYTDDATTAPASYDRRSAPAALVRSVGADHAVWWTYAGHAVVLVDSSASVDPDGGRVIVLVLPSQWLAPSGPEEAALQSPLTQDLISGDVRRVLSAVWQILRTHDRAVLTPLAPALAMIERATADLDLGGALIANSSHLARALDRVRLASAGTCLCTTYPMGQLSDPAKEAELGHVRIESEVPNDRQWVPDRICVCAECGRRYQVEEGDYHYRWWQWRPLD